MQEASYARNHTLLIPKIPFFWGWQGESIVHFSGIIIKISEKQLKTYEMCVKIAKLLLFFKKTYDKIVNIVH